MANLHRFPAFYGGDTFGIPAAYWEVGWLEELVSFYAQLVVNEEGEDTEGWGPEDHQPLCFFGHRSGEFLEPEQLEAAMQDEEQDVRLPRQLVEQLRADRNRHVEGLSREQQRELIERVKAS